MYIYTKKGTYHKQRNEESGDVVRGTDSGDYAIIALADGVSSCKYGPEGAKMASSFALDYINEQFSRFRFLPEKWPTYMLNYVKQQLNEFVQYDKSIYSDHSTTLMILIIDREKNLMHYCNIGDGLIIAVDDNMCSIICLPQRRDSRCLVITTEGIENEIISGTIDLNNVNCIVACSDGAWEKMYDHNMLKPEIKNILLSGNHLKLKDVIDESKSIDDCSFAFADVRRVS